MSIPLSRSQKRNARRSRLSNEKRNSGGMDVSNDVEDTEEKEIEQDADKDKKERMRQSVIDEIVQSEAKYLEDLYTMRIFYILPLRQGKFPEVTTNSKGDIMMLFSTIELIFDGNTELLESLKKEVQKPEPKMIGQVFMAMADQLCQYYGVFCNHQKEAMDSISQLAATSANIKSFLESSKLKPETAGLGVLDFLVKPFQRIMKYPLLLKELAKFTPDTHPDKTNIQSAVTKLESEVDLINKNKFKNDNMKKMVEISQNVDSLPRHFKIMIPSRYFVYEGTLMKISGKHNQERHFFLFNDCLMYCKKRGAGKYQCKGVIFLTKLQVEDIDQVSFRVHRTDKDLTYILYGKEQQEKQVWMHQLGKILDKLNPSSRSLPTKKSQPGEIKEVIRVYVSNDTFKTFPITNNTSTGELCIMCSKKVKIEAAEVTYKIWLVLNGNPERALESFEKPMEVMQSLQKRGIKFNDQNYFKMMMITGQGAVYQSALSEGAADTLRQGSLPNSLPGSQASTMRAGNHGSVSPRGTIEPSSPTSPRSEPSSPRILERPLSPKPSERIPEGQRSAPTTMRVGNNPNVSPRGTIEPVSNSPSTPKPPRPMSPRGNLPTPPQSSSLRSTVEIVKTTQSPIERIGKPPPPSGSPRKLISAPSAEPMPSQPRSNLVRSAPSRTYSQPKGQPKPPPPSSPNPNAKLKAPLTASNGGTLKSNFSGRPIPQRPLPPTPQNF